MSEELTAGGHLAVLGMTQRHLLALVFWALFHTTALYDPESMLIALRVAYVPITAF